MLEHKTVFSDKLDGVILHGNEADNFLRLLHGVDQQVWNDIKQDKNNHRELQASIVGEMSHGMRSHIRDYVTAIYCGDGIKLKDILDDSDLIKTQKLSPEEKEFVTRCFISASEKKQPSALADQLKEVRAKQSNAQVGNTKT